ncbi:MAG: ATP-binding protein [Chitinivibrionales bacterium]|nr:ATP-binding protein [Chitinivibrionales bacterium]MBD3396309.1 ATP-binding protein [Chitinivibrionales bacterium]
MKKKIALAWSGGKDAAMALHALKLGGEYDIACLLTTITEDYDRISLHGVRRALLEAQASSAGLPLEHVAIPANSLNEEYETRMREACARLFASGIRRVAFGDLFLPDVRAYRERNLAGAGMEAVFPLWNRDTKELAAGFVRLGFKAVLVCVDTQKLDASFAGREFNDTLVGDLPKAVDPCGENGEFHSFVYDGPVFAAPVAFGRGECVLREDRFRYCDLVPV